MSISVQSASCKFETEINQHIIRHRPPQVRSRASGYRAVYIFLSEEVLESDPQLALDSSDGKPFGYVSRQQFSDTRCEIRGLSQTQPSRGFELLSAELPFFVCLKLHSGGVLAKHPQSQRIRCVYTISLSVRMQPRRRVERCLLLPSLIARRACPAR